MKKSNRNKRKGIGWFLANPGLFLILVGLAWAVWLLIKYHLKLI